MEKIAKTSDYFYQACSNITTKCVAVVVGILVDFHFGDISNSLLSALFMLILFDFITGIWATRHTKEKIKSAKIFNTAWKFVLYFMAVSAGYFAELVIGYDLFISKTILIFLALTELVSLLENIEKGGYPMPLNLIHKLKNLLKNK